MITLESNIQYFVCTGTRPDTIRESETLSGILGGASVIESLGFYPNYKPEDSFIVNQWFENDSTDSIEKIREALYFLNTVRENYSQECVLVVLNNRAYLLFNLEDFITLWNVFLVTTQGIVLRDLEESGRLRPGF